MTTEAETQPATIDSYQAYEALMGNKGQPGKPSDEKVDHGEQTQEHGKTSPEGKGGGQATSTEKGSDKDHEGEDKTGAADDADLDPRFKKRLDRETRRAKRAEGELERIGREVAELRKQRAAPATVATDDEDEPYPERANYQNEDSFTEDIKLWEDGKPLKHRPTAKPDKGGAVSPGTELTQEQRWEQHLKTLSPEARELAVRRVDIVNDWLADLDTLQGDDEGLSGDFKDLLLPKEVNGQMQPPEVLLSDAMLQWLDDHPKESVEIARIFVKTPSTSRRIHRKVTAEGQTQALKELVKPKEDKPKPEKTAPEKTELPAPDMQPFSGTNPPKTEGQKFNTYKEYEDWMHGQKKENQQPAFRR